jgi:type I restriction enzyme S subunit
LIAEKALLLERLAELRYSMVSWAVAGGLHAHRGTYPTGHKFIPALPLGWQLGGLTKYIGPVVDYRGKTPEKVEEGVLLVTARNIREGLLDYSASAEYIRKEVYDEVMRRGRPVIGDVLFTTGNL